MKNSLLGAWIAISIAFSTTNPTKCALIQIQQTQPKNRFSGQKVNHFEDRVLEDFKRGKELLKHNPDHPCSDYRRRYRSILSRKHYSAKNPQKKNQFHILSLSQTRNHVGYTIQLRLGKKKQKIEFMINTGNKKIKI